MGHGRRSIRVVCAMVVLGPLMGCTGDVPAPPITTTVESKAAGRTAPPKETPPPDLPSEPSRPDTTTGQSGEPREPRKPSRYTPEERQQITAQKYAGRGEELRDWLRDLGVPAYKIDLMHVDLTPVRGKVTDQALRALSDNPVIESMTLDGCNNITGAGVEKLLLLPNLKKLSFRNCSGLRTDDFMWLFTNDKLDEVDLRDCKNIDPDLFKKVGGLRTKVLGP